MMRLQKYLALSGVASRRSAEKMIADGRVTVDGEVITEMGVQVEIGQDIRVDGKLVTPEPEKKYIMYHKPAGEVTTASDPEGRATVLDKFRDYPVRLDPVGRLDYDTSGLLLLTNDGDLTYKLTHPKHDVDKTYIAKLHGIPDEGALQKFRRGVTIDGVKTKPAKIQIIDKDKDGRYCVAEIIIHEGRNRQVRKMCEAIKHPVMQLQRVATGDLKLGDLAKGKYRHLTEKEVKYLKKL